MYCPKCGAQIPDVARFCSVCGAAVPPASHAQTPPALVRYDVPQGKPGKTAKKGKKAGAIIIAAACVLVLAGAILVPVLISGAKAARYREAIALMDSGEMAQAKAAFEKQGDYEQAAAKAVECQNILDYDAAVALMDAKDNKKAKDAFLKLGGYKDSAQLAAKCGRRIDYDAAKALMDDGDYEAASAAFAALADYSDAAELAQQCRYKIDYNAADTAYSQGKFYTAYTLFSSLGSYADSAARAEACMQAYPASGELYRNDAYSSKSCSLTIITANDGSPTFLKFYTGDDTLVSTVFIASGENSRVKLPAGTYKMKSATGREWFGAEEMFGNDGHYQLLTFGNGAVTTSLQSGYTYTLTLRSAADGNVGSQNVDRDDF